MTSATTEPAATSFTEKLRRATQQLNKAKASISAGLAPTTISNYLATGSIPRADIALKIARAIGVPVEWLIDDEQGSSSPTSPTPAPPMNFTEKLDRLTRDLNKSDVAREAGLPATAISDYLQKGYIPRTDKALAIARAVNVPLEWLADPAQGWPPPSPASAAPTTAASPIPDALTLGLRLLNELAALHVEMAALREELAEHRR